MPNIIKIDRSNFELYRFKVGPFFETQCTYRGALSIACDSRQLDLYKRCSTAVIRPPQSAALDLHPVARPTTH